MCRFFSCMSDGRRVYYFDAEMRKKILAGETDYLEADSHTSIARHFGFIGRQEDSLNKYAYNPLTREFQVDQLNTTDDSAMVEKFCQNLDFSTVVPELVIKPIVHLLDRDGRVSDVALELLKKWASVGASARESVGASIRESVGTSVGASVGDAVWGAAWALVWDSVGPSPWDSVWVSAWDSVWANISSFFALKRWKGFESLPEGKNPFQPAISLWAMGLIPSFDGETWRLHAKSGIVWEGKL